MPVGTPLHGLVLAGGQSRRMRQDKAYLVYDGAPQLRRAFDLVASVVARCFVSVRQSQHDDPLRAAFPQIVDRLEDRGPAAGILAALESHPGVGWLVVACDLPLLDPAALQTLVSSRASDADATAYISRFDGKPEPLCAIWEPSSRAALATSIERGDASLRRVLAQLRIHLIHPERDEALFNTNTPEEADAIRSGLLRPDM